jgi:metallo-beta-lactamase family protein
MMGADSRAEAQMELEFFGAAGEVTGSCHILRVGDTRILLDCGMIQGGRKAEARNREPFPFRAETIDAVVLSHAHIDHSGRLPLLCKRGFTGPIYTQNASADLTRILLADAAFLEEMETEHENRRRERKGLGRIKPLYSRHDAEMAVSQLEGRPYNVPIEVGQGVKVTFHDAGHILGSAAVEVQVHHQSTSRRLVFSGDLGQFDTPILRDPELLKTADLVLMESTYGSRLHRDRAETIREIGEVVQAAGADKGNILIPAFAVGRSQEVLYQLGMHFNDWGLDRWRVFLDSPLAIEASEIYWNYPQLYDAEARSIAQNSGMPPLPNLQLSHTAKESMAINRIQSGAIVIAGSGMCTGGRILHHLRHNVWRPQCHVIIVGYQAKGSLGRRLVDGHDYIKIRGETIRVAAQIHTVGGLSAHADRDDLCRWFNAFEDSPPLFLVHGEVESGEALADHLRKTAGANVTLSQPGLKIDLQGMRWQNGGSTDH